MKNYIIIILLTILIISCNTEQNNQKEYIDNEEVCSNKEISFEIYPTGVPENVTYGIYLKQGKIHSINHLKNDSTIITLSEKQYAELDSMCYNIKIGNIRYICTYFLLDAWEAKLIIDNDTVFHSSDIGFNIPLKEEASVSEIYELINYLIHVSKIEIDLYGFG